MTGLAPEARKQIRIHNKKWGGRPHAIHAVLTRDVCALVHANRIEISHCTKQAPILTCTAVMMSAIHGARGLLLLPRGDTAVPPPLAALQAELLDNQGVVFNRVALAMSHMEGDLLAELLRWGRQLAGGCMPAWMVACCLC